MTYRFNGISLKLTDFLLETLTVNLKLIQRSKVHMVVKTTLKITKQRWRTNVTCSKDLM